MEKSRKLRLEAVVEEDFYAAGIACALRDYRLAFQLNQHLFLGLERIADAGWVEGSPPEDGGFSRYRAVNELDKSEIYLISNRFNGKTLLSAQRQADFILLACGSWYADEFPDLLASVRPLPEIQTVFSIKPRHVEAQLNDLMHEAPQQQDKDHRYGWSGY
jgi:hypothetical protein